MFQIVSNSASSRRRASPRAARRALLDDEELLHQLRRDEEGVGVAVRERVGVLVQGHAVDGHRHVLPVVAAKAAQRDLRRVARAALVAQRHSGNERQQFRCVEPRQRAEPTDAHRQVPCAARERLAVDHRLARAGRVLRDGSARQGEEREREGTGTHDGASS